MQLLFRCFLFLFACYGCQQEKGHTTWSHYKGSPENIHYSSLTQIDTATVKNLQVAWTFRTGDADTAHSSQIQCNPIIVDGRLYGTTPQMALFSLDAATGKELWRFDPFDTTGGLDNKGLFFILNNSRGVAYWSDAKKESRIFYTAGSHLYCIDAGTGRPVKAFGKGGRLDLHTGLDRDVANLFITATSPPIIFNDLLIIGSRVDEGPMAAPGHIRAYDVRTGERRWIFHTIPFPGEEGYNTWDDSTAYKFIGGANSWSGFSLDKERGILFACTGSASYDFYGGRRTGDNLFANCLLALDAATGKRKWHFQFVHHDVWDRDVPSAPALVRYKKEGAWIDAAAVTTKTGYVYVFDRETGKPLFDIEERPVPTVSELTGEKLSPTQPFPVAPASFMRQRFTENDINPYLSDSSFADVKRRLLSYKNGHVYEPISRQGTIVFPGLDGGAEWGGPSFDPETGLLYINANEMPWVLQAVAINKQPVKAENFEQAGRRLYQRNCMTCHGAERQGSGNNPSLLGIEKKYSAEAFHTLVRSGRRMMPAFQQLNENEREAIATYVLNKTESKSKAFAAKESDERFQLPYTITGYNKFLSKEGYPAIAPPWGTLQALDIATGNYVWKQVLGHDTAVKGAKGPTGTENYGASVVTKGGLLLIAATKDGKFRAFNKRNGQLLWETDLPAPAFATPAVYESGGKQFIVIACGGGKLKTRSGDSYVAFALPGK
ncbi:PQQ-binding-like beta-propeller repeat protein [Flavisolibacter sp. BT320]|nr:PQQ-binding-like beta-propeller repeat protein [Flavisolibacter longurius]